MTGRLPFRRSVIDRVRRLALHHGQPPDAIACALGIDPGDVARILDRPIMGRLDAKVRAMHAAGDSAEAIAVAMALPIESVTDYLSRVILRPGGRKHRARPRSLGAQAVPPGKRRGPSKLIQLARRMACDGVAPDVIASTLRLDAGDVARILDRPIKGALASAIRAMNAAGESAEAIAAGVGLAVDRVRDYTDRLPPTRKRPPRPGKSLAPEWSYIRGPAHRDDVDGQVVTGIAAEDLGAEDFGGDRRPEQGAGISPATSIEEWGSVHATAGVGGQAPNAAMTDHDAWRMRRLRDEGMTRRALAERFNVSMATVGRVLAGQTYRDAVPEAHQGVVEEPSASAAIASAEAPRRSVWTELPGPGPEWRDD